jgi:hypothetical protein
MKEKPPLSDLTDRIHEIDEALADYEASLDQEELDQVNDEL